MCVATEGESNREGQEHLALLGVGTPVKDQWDGQRVRELERNGCCNEGGSRPRMKFSEIYIHAERRCGL